MLEILSSILEIKLTNLNLFYNTTSRSNFNFIGLYSGNNNCALINESLELASLFILDLVSSA